MEDTIAAISTALGNGSISIIRLSGKDAIEIVDKLFLGKSLLRVNSHTINYGKIKFNNNIIDEVMVSVMHAPKTYTRENIVEINCHGGIYVTQNVLRAVLSSGARLAQPGEFTKRAFINGRIDLTQSEAVMDLINAKSNLALKNSLNQMSGVAKSIIDNLRNQILMEIAYIEASLDDPEHYELDNYGVNIKDKIVEIKNKIQQLIEDSLQGAILKEGIKCAIIGLPNAGKSSLLNILSNKDRAIVTNIAGTTRDIIQEQVLINDIPINIIDTAGIRKTDDIIEQLGVKKAFESIDEANLILYVLDASNEVIEDDIEILNKLDDEKTIIVLNKIDKENSKLQFTVAEKFSTIVKISALKNENINLLKDKIIEKVCKDKYSPHDELYIANERQREYLISALDSIEKVVETIDMGMAEDFLTIDLTQCYISLGKILGEELEDDIIDKIFKEFCMGK